MTSKIPASPIRLPIAPPETEQLTDFHLDGLTDSLSDGDREGAQ